MFSNYDADKNANKLYCYITSIMICLCLCPNQAVDAVYFNGGNADGQFFVCATARRHKKLIQTLNYIRVSDYVVSEFYM